MEIDSSLVNNDNKPRNFFSEMKEVRGNRLVSTPEEESLLFSAVGIIVVSFAFTALATVEMVTRSKKPN